MFSDPVAVETFADFQRQHPFNTIVETGTGLRRGTLYCSHFRKNVCTIEINEELRKHSLANIEANGYTLDNVNIGMFVNEISMVRSDPEGRRAIFSFLGNSPQVLDYILGSGRFSRPFLFYLDAHWYDYWPLLDELRIIRKYGLSDSYIIIHDFQVPGKPFGFDSYNGQPLNLDYVRADLFNINPDFQAYYNDRVCEGPNGRGILYVVPGTGAKNQ